MSAVTSRNLCSAGLLLVFSLLALATQAPQEEEQKDATAATDGETPSPGECIPVESTATCPADCVPLESTFDADLEPTRWTVYDSSGVRKPGDNVFDGNVTAKDGTAVLTAYKDGETMHGAEMESTAFVTFGRFSVRMKPSCEMGIVTAFFTIDQNHSVEDNNHEIDIEILRDQYGLNAWLTTWRRAGLPDEKESTKVSLDDSYCDEMRTYGFDWMQDLVVFHIEGVDDVSHTQVVPTRPMKLLLQSWVGCTAFLAETAPCPASIPASTSTYDDVSYSCTALDRNACDVAVPDFWPRGEVVRGRRMQGSSGDFACDSDVYPSGGVRVSPGGGEGLAWYDFEWPAAATRLTVDLVWTDNAWWADTKEFRVYDAEKCVWETLAAWDTADAQEHTSSFDIPASYASSGQVRVGVWGAPSSCIQVASISAR
jgi:hypothetical protein